MRRTWTIIGVGDVPGSLKWYQSLLGLTETAPAHDYFGQLLDSDGTVLLCLHQWGAHEHPSLTSPDHAEPGNGLLLFLRVDDFDMALKRARALVARLEEEPSVNPNTGTMEFALRDPDGYYVMISADNKTQCGSGAIEPAKLIWDEYKYRHEHCWKLIFQITIAVVIISIIPYSQVHVGERLKERIVLLPLVGFALTLFGLARLNGEMKILDKLRIRHREIQSELHHGIEYGKETGVFSRHVHRYLGFILILEVLNAIVLLFLWIKKE